jgi:hypothetical protein
MQHSVTLGYAHVFCDDFAKCKSELYKVHLEEKFPMKDRS